MSLGNVDLTLGLNTGPATQALTAYVQAMQQGANKAAASQKQVDTALKKQKDAIVNIREEYDKSGKVIGQVFETQSQVNKRLASEAKKATEATKRGTKATQESGNAAQNAAEKIKKVGAAGKTAGDTVEREFNEAKAAMDRLGTSAGTTANKIRSGFQDAIKGIPQGIGLAVGQQLTQTLMNIPRAATAAAAGAVQAFAEIDKSLRQTLAISGADVEMFDELAKFMNDLASETKFTADELAEASVQLARAGMSAEELQDALPGIAMGAAAAGESMAGMSDVVIAALGGFQLGADQASDVADVLTQAANNANTSVVELGEGLKYAAPAANALGLSLEDTSAVLGMLANKGIKASQAGTTLRMGLSRLARAAAGTNSEFAEYSRGSSKLSGVLQKMGADIKDANGNLVAMPQLLSKLRDGFSKLEGTEKNLAASILFGEEAATGWIALLDTNAQAVEEFFDKTNNAAGVASETARKNLSGFSGALELLRSATGSVQAAFGKFLATGLEPVVRGITALLNAFNALPAPIQNTVMAVAVLTAGVGALALAIGVLKALGIGAIFSSMIGSAASAGMAMTALAGTIGSKVVAAFAGLEVMMLRNVAGIQGSLIPSVAALQTKLTMAAGASKALTVALAAINLTAIGLAVASLALVWDGWNQAMKGANETSKAFAETTKGINGLINQQTQELINNGNAWEISNQRVGFFVATFDKVLDFFGLATYEEAQLTQATIRLGEEMEEFDTKMSDVRQQITKLNKDLASGTLSSEEQVKARERLNELYKVSVKDVKALRAELTKQLKAELALAGASGDLGEAEKTRIDGLKAAIKNLDSELKLLDALVPASNAAASGMDNFSASNEKAADSAKKVEAAVEALNAKIKTERTVMADDKREFDRIERQVKMEENAAKRSFDAKKAAIEKAQNAAMSAAKKQAEAEKQAQNAAITAYDNKGRKILDNIARANQEMEKAAAAELLQIQNTIAMIEKKGAAQLATYDRQIGALREMTPAEAQLAAIEEERLRIQAKQGGEEGLRAQAQLERMEREKEILELEDQKAQKAAEIAAKKEQAEKEQAAREEALAVEKANRDQELADKQRAHEQAVTAAREAAAASQAATAERLAALQEGFVTKLARLQEAEDARRQQADVEKEAREDAHMTKREAAQERIADMEKEITTLEKESAEEKKELDDEVLENQTENQQTYRDEIEKTNEMIVVEGEAAWAAYSDNATAELAKVEAAAVSAARAAAAAARAGGGTNRGTTALPTNFAGGPIGAGQLTHINEMGQEAFLGKSGQLSMINKKPWEVWRAPESGVIIPAAQAAAMAIPDRGVNVAVSPTITAPAASSHASGGATDRLMRAIAALRDSGGRVTNNVSIESANPVQDASDMMVELQKIKRRRFG